MKRKIIYLFSAGFVVVTLILGISLTGSYLVLKGSLLNMDGEVVFPSLGGEVKVEFNEYGVPLIKAANRNDAARVLGYLHARERLFSMEMHRRLAAGEMSEILGPGLLELDERLRLYSFRERSKTSILGMSDDDKLWLQCYSEGVNFGISSMKTMPWELILLGDPMETWKPEDSLLVGYAMYVSLQENLRKTEECRAIMKEELPAEVYEYFVNNGSSWSATMDGKNPAFRKIPGRDSFGYLSESATLPEVAGCEELTCVEGLVPGSNAWAISGKLTQSGAAMLANDMHLSLGLPNIWYRTSLEYQRKGVGVQLTGATLPGLPFVVIGSNKNLAWGFTNSKIDSLDHVELELDPENMDRYMTTEGSKAFSYRYEDFKVKGGKMERRTYKESVWGPVFENKEGTLLALKWTAFEGDGVNLRLGDFDTIQTVEEAIGIAPVVALPTLNLIAADSDGGIAWSLIGPVMVREGYRGDVPVLGSESSAVWRLMDGAQYPRVVNPKDGYVWSANNQALGDEFYLDICNMDASTPARSHQIGSRLADLGYPVSESDLLKIQLDIEAPFYHRWRSLLLAILEREESGDDALRSGMEEAVRDWDGMAHFDSLGFRLIKDFRSEVAKKVLSRLLLPCYERSSDFDYSNFRFEEPLWMIVSSQPEYLCSKDHEDWASELSGCLDRQIQSYGPNPDLGKLKERKSSKVQIRHPISRMIPFLSLLIDTPEAWVSGDKYTVKVVSSDFGSTERMVVSPGRESEGIFHMPGGQSGHFLSPYYQKGHDDWINGTSASFEPKGVAHVLVFHPVAEN